MRSALFSVLALMVPTAAAQDVATPAPGAYTTEEAAWCAVVFARMAEATAALPDVPDAMREQSQIGAMIWEYELIASAPGREDFIQRAALGAVDALAAQMPQGDDAAAANARGEFLMSRAKGCSERIDQIYQNAPHPIVQRLLAQREVPPPPARQKPGLR